MKKTCLMTLAAVAVALSGCSTRGTSYVETLHRSWTDISRAVENDGSLNQRDLFLDSNVSEMQASEYV